MLWVLFFQGEMVAFVIKVTKSSAIAACCINATSVDLWRKSNHFLYAARTPALPLNTKFTS